MNNSDDLNSLTKYIDDTVRLQDDFFTFVNGKWLKETEIPEDKARWGSFIILNEKSINDVKGLLESNDFNDDDFNKIKKFYKEGMDVQKRNKLDIQPSKVFYDDI